MDMEVVHRIGIYDGHCHPTDNMDSIDQIAGMKAKGLTIMSTRSQDQDLVVSAAEQYPISGRDDIDKSDTGTFVVPAFGWHPWFSHQMYFDLESDSGPESVDEPSKSPPSAVDHYKSILTPVPDDHNFLTTLSPPFSFSRYLHEAEQRLLRFPHALVGEIGLDRGFRLPENPRPGPPNTNSTKNKPTPGTREGRPLTPYKVSLPHQKRILKAQLSLAAKHNRAVSLHSVQAHGIVFEVLQDLWKGHLRPSKRERKKKRADAEDAVDPDENGSMSAQTSLPYPPRICMHSYSGPKDAIRQFLDPKVPTKVFFGFSECINFIGSDSAAERATEVVRAVPEDRLLVESDLNCAGPRMDRMLEGIVKRICETKGWDAEGGARRLRQNWEAFVFGE